MIGLNSPESASIAWGAQAHTTTSTTSLNRLSWHTPTSQSQSTPVLIHMSQTHDPLGLPLLAPTLPMSSTSTPTSTPPLRLREEGDRHFGLSDLARPMIVEPANSSVKNGVSSVQPIGGQKEGSPKEEGPETLKGTMAGAGALFGPPITLGEYHFEVLPSSTKTHISLDSPSSSSNNGRFALEPSTPRTPTLETSTEGRFVGSTKSFPSPVHAGFRTPRSAVSSDSLMRRANANGFRNARVLTFGNANDDKVAKGDAYANDIGRRNNPPTNAEPSSSNHLNGGRPTNPLGANNLQPVHHSSTSNEEITWQSPWKTKADQGNVHERVIPPSPHGGRQFLPAVDEDDATVKGDPAGLGLPLGPPSPALPELLISQPSDSKGKPMEQAEAGNRPETQFRGQLQRQQPRQTQSFQRSPYSPSMPVLSEDNSPYSQTASGKRVLSWLSASKNDLPDRRLGYTQSPTDFIAPGDVRGRGGAPGMKRSLSSRWFGKAERPASPKSPATFSSRGDMLAPAMPTARRSPILASGFQISSDDPLHVLNAEKSTSAQSRSITTLPPPATFAPSRETKKDRHPTLARLSNLFGASKNKRPPTSNTNTNTNTNITTNTHTPPERNPSRIPNPPRSGPKRRSASMFFLSNIVNGNKPAVDKPNTARQPERASKAAAESRNRQNNDIDIDWPSTNKMQPPSTVPSPRRTDSRTVSTNIVTEQVDEIKREAELIGECRATPHLGPSLSLGGRIPDNQRQTAQQPEQRNRLQGDTIYSLNSHIIIADSSFTFSDEVLHDVEHRLATLRPNVMT